MTEQTMDDLRQELVALIQTLNKDGWHEDFHAYDDILRRIAEKREEIHGHDPA